MWLNQDFPKYLIHQCTNSAGTNFPGTLPTAQDKIWTITKTSTAVKIECNNVEALNYVFLESTNGLCTAIWSRDSENLFFPSSDTASVGYRPLGL